MSAAEAMSESTPPPDVLRDARQSSLKVIEARYDELTRQWSHGDMSDTQLEAIVVIDDIPRLLSELRRLQAEVDQLKRERSKIYSIVEGPDDHRTDCPWWAGGGCMCFENEERERARAVLSGGSETPERSED